jgi:hypothetical protein
MEGRGLYFVIFTCLVPAQNGQRFKSGKPSKKKGNWLKNAIFLYHPAD